jgi:hypothetical protein
MLASPDGISYDTHIAQCERLNDLLFRTLNREELFWEPELEEGSISRLLESGGRVVDVGKSDGSVGLLKRGTS